MEGCQVSATRRTLVGRELVSVMLILWLTSCMPTAVTLTSTPGLVPTATVPLTLEVGPTPTTVPDASPTAVATVPAGDGELTGDEISTLMSLEQADGFPLYTMRFVGAYGLGAQPDESAWLQMEQQRVPASDQTGWGCSLFAALGDAQSSIYGRNFDWEYSPALLLFTDPPDGYASVSMVDIAYLGFANERAANLTELPVEQRRALLGAPGLPFDGMNERGLSIGMAAVPPGEMSVDPQKETVDQLRVIREILDHAGTVDEAIGILGQYNIDMGSVPLHYLIASASGQSALVEFYRGEMVVFRNESDWQVATNFLVASTDGQPEGQCWRYDRITERLAKTGGRLATADAFSLLAEVSQNHTQWSIVYEMANGAVTVVMGRDYTGQVHSFQLERSGR
jgi:hypothetical protein